MPDLQHVVPEIWKAPSYLKSLLRTQDVVCPFQEMLLATSGGPSLRQDTGHTTAFLLGQADRVPHQVAQHI